MRGLKPRLIAAAVVTFAAAGALAGPALASSDGVTVGSIGSLKAGAKAGTVGGEVVNRTGHAVDAKVTVRIQRTGAAAKFVGKTAVRVPANASAGYTVAVKLPGATGVVAVVPLAVLE